MAALLLAATLTPPAAAQPWVANCTPVHVVQAAGTGFSHSWHPDARITLFDDGSSPADDLQRRFGNRRIGFYQVKYPATLGRFSVFGSPGWGAEGTENATYGESVAYGRDDAVREMRTVAKSCPATRFILVGYSQGAHLIGDAAALVAAGQVPFVGPDQIAAVVLFADPGRAPLTPPAQAPRPARLYAPAPFGVRGANFETVQAGGSPLNPAFVGMAGVRPGSFNGLEGKVLSLCNAADMACATPADSPLLAVSRVAMREEWVGPTNAVTGMHIGTLTALLAEGKPLKEALLQSGLSLFDAPFLLSILPEIALILGAADHATVGEAGTPPEQRVAVALMAALPELAKEGATWPYLLSALEGVRRALPAGTEEEPGLAAEAAEWFDVALETMRAVDAAERVYLQLASAGAVPRVPTPTEGRQTFAHSLVAGGMDQLAAATGLDAAMRANPKLVESARIAGDFGPQHMSYYKLGYTDSFSVGGRTGYDYALAWLDEVVAGVLAH